MSSHLSLVNKSLSAPESKPMDMSVKLKYPQLSFEKNYERLLTLHENTASSGPMCCHLVVEKFNNETSAEFEIQSFIDFIKRSKVIIQDSSKKHVFTYMEKEIHLFLNRVAFELTAIEHRGSLEKADYTLDINKYGFKYTVAINSHRVVDCMDQDCPDFFTNSLYIPF